MADEKLMQVQAFDQVMQSIGRLHKIGGISLMLSASAVSMAVLLMVYSAFTPEFGTDLHDRVPRLYDFILLIGLAGALIGGLEQFAEYRMASRQLEMMATVTEELVRACIPKNHAMDTAQIRVITDEVFKNVWKYSALNKPKGGSSVRSFEIPGDRT